MSFNIFIRKPEVFDIVESEGVADEFDKCCERLEARGNRSCAGPPSAHVVTLQLVNIVIVDKIEGFLHSGVDLLDFVGSVWRHGDGAWL